MPPQRDRGGTMAAIDAHRQRALSLLTTDAARKAKQPGGDHWPQAMSVLVAGGGLKTGQVVGSTNARGEHPKDRPLTPNDLWATMFRHLGIDWNNTSFPDHRGRPMPILPYGEPIAELL